LGKSLTKEQWRRVLTEALELLTGRTVDPRPLHRVKKIIRNEEGNAFHRGLIDLRNGSPLAQCLWRLRELVICFLGPGTGEFRLDFHMSFDSL